MARLTSIVAILRDAIISNIPQIIDLFATRYNRTASNAISVLSKISEHGERSYRRAVLDLTRISRKDL